MANKRKLQKAINLICEDLISEALAVSLYGSENHKDDVESVFFSIVKMQADFICRISHPEPGMKAKEYYKDLKDKFAAQASDILDQIIS